MERLVEGLKRARDLAAGPDAAEPVVENSVGEGTQLCSTFEGLSRVAEGAEVRVCVDTAHAFLAGYDLSSPKGAATVGGELRGARGDRIALLHLNDARNGLGSHRDGHARIGEGQVFGGGLLGVLRGARRGSGGDGDAVRDAGGGRRAGPSPQTVGGRVASARWRGIKSPL